MYLSSIVQQPAACPGAAGARRFGAGSEYSPGFTVFWSPGGRIKNVSQLNQLLKEKYEAEHTSNLQVRSRPPPNGAAL